MESAAYFRFVIGFLPEIDRLPEAAIRMGLRYRLAAILNYDAVPHSQLYWDLIDSFVESVPSDSLLFELEAGKALLSFPSVSLMRVYTHEHTQVSRPFDRATFIFRSKVSAYLDIEPWAMIGGPFPYHDSWTFSFYRDVEDITRIRDACYHVCDNYGVHILDEMHGLPFPKEAPRWKRVIQWLVR